MPLWFISAIPAHARNAAADQTLFTDEFEGETPFKK
jgi:hypothetical protein